MNTRMTIRGKLWLLLIPLSCLLCMSSDCNIWLFFSLLTLAAMVAFCGQNINRHIFFLLFLAAFFVFLMGGQICYDLFGIEMEFNYTDVEFNHLNLSIFLSLFCLFIGYFVGDHFDGGDNDTSGGEPEREDHRLIQEISMYSFYVLAIPWFIILAEECMTVQTSKYVDLYTFHSRFPIIVAFASAMCPFAMSLFLATLPDKRRAYPVLGLVSAYAVMSILTGRRIFFVTYILLVFGYMFARNTEEETWISKRHCIMLIAMLPFLIVFLYSYRYIRYHKTVEASTFFDAFMGFFAQQGYSANLIPLSLRYHFQLGDFYFSFYSLIRAAKDNVISQFFFGPDIAIGYTGSRLLQALYSGSLGQKLSYLLMPKQYMQGFGMGTCYIAELYHDFGYIGICIGNLVYGFVMGHFVKLKKGRLFATMAALLMFRRFLMAPRYNYDYPFDFLTSVSFWMYMLAVYGTVAIIQERYKTRFRGVKT